VFRRLLLLAVLLIAGLACAQQRHNYLAVDGRLVEAGPYYFIEHGDSSNAFARASVLAEAMGLRVEYLGEQKLLRFTDGYRVVTFEATADVRAGLEKRPGIVKLDPLLRGSNTLDSPMAILVDGVSYVPITPLVTAFDGQSDWNAAARLVTIDTAELLGHVVPAPRVGVNGGYTRVALDLPADATYQLAAGSRSFVVVVPGARAEPATIVVDDDHLGSVSVASSSGRVTVTVTTRFDLDPEGRGYAVGTVPKANGNTLYVDFAPDRTGAAVTAIGQPRPASEPQALAQAPRGRQVVVIDAGHGGHDPGANSRHATEKAVVLAVARMLAERLEAAGLEVILTRDHDTFLTLQQRSEFATTDKNIFVSIHANSADKSSAEGIETWVFGEPLDPALIERAIRENGGGAVGEELTREARRVADQLAFDILREAQFNLSLSLAESVQSHLVSATGAKDRGVRTNLFYVLRTARIPAILVELGFVSNPDEGSRLSDPRYQAVLADGLADGILAFLANGGAVARR